MGDTRVRVEVLGPVRVIEHGGQDRTPTGILQRRLLGLLVLRRGRFVSADAAIEALWPADLPHDPSAALQNHVSRLRRLLPTVAIDTVGDGYRLDPTTIAVDVDLVSTVIDAGLAADPATIAELGALLDRWHGPAFPELDHVDDALAESARLAELRLRAHELRAEWRLARGETDGVVAELTRLADTEPLRERPRSLLMTALAADGRHAEALRVFDDFRRRLGDELGIDPSPSLAAQHAALLTGESPPATAPGRLPRPTTDLLGREALVADVMTALSDVRALTLVGPGGVGKTRVLLEVGHRLVAERADRAVVLGELTGADPRTAADVTAAAFGIDARPGVDPADRIAAVVGDDEMVLLLDNCEHVIEPIATLVETLLRRCPRLCVVATSRERLRVPGEHVRQVPPLPVGPADTPAMQLFLDRARAAVPDFDPGTDELATIAEVVRRLDGLPLALELAAARLFTHDLDELASGLERRFTLLTTGSRSSPRHASLGAAVAWSFEALDPGLQHLFSDISLFVSPFSAHDAAAAAGRDASVIEPLLAELVERSLVTRAPGRRYTLLETLRSFGCERLVESGRIDAVTARHASHFVDLAESADRDLTTPGRSTIAEIDAAVPELQAALDRSLALADVEQAARIVVALLDYGLLRLRPDVLAWSERVIDTGRVGDARLAARSWAVAAYAAWLAGDVAATLERSERGLALASDAAVGPPSELLTIRANVELFEGRLDSAVDWYEHAIAAAEADGDVVQQRFVTATELLARSYASDPTTRARADALVDAAGTTNGAHAAYLWFCSGEALVALDPATASVRLTRAIELADASSASFVGGLAGASRASIEARSGDPQRAAADYRRLIDHWRRAGVWSTQWTMMRSIAGLLERLGRHRAAAVLVGAVSATGSGHRIFGADAVALGELEQRLRTVLGEQTYAAAYADGAVLDDDAAAEHALRSLRR